MLSGLPEHQEVVAVFSSSMQPGTDTAGLCPAGHHPHPCSVLLAGCCRALPCPFALGPWLACPLLSRCTLEETLSPFLF